jgi:hypothetical protein
MSEVFKVIGVVISTLIADLFIFLVYAAICDAWEDENLWIFPLVINVIGFVAVTTILICERI